MWTMAASRTIEHAAFRFNFCNLFNVVTFLRNVVREDRSSPAPGAKAAVDQGAAAVESGFLLN